MQFGLSEVGLLRHLLFGSSVDALEESSWKSLGQDLNRQSLLLHPIPRKMSEVSQDHCQPTGGCCFGLSAIVYPVSAVVHLGAPLPGVRSFERRCKPRRGWAETPKKWVLCQVLSIEECIVSRIMSFFTWSIFICKVDPCSQQTPSQMS